MSVRIAPNYKAVVGWEQLPAGYSHPDVAAVAVDSKDRVFLFCRSEHPVMIYEGDGRFVWRRLPPKRLKGIGYPSLWALRRVE